MGILQIYACLYEKGQLRAFCAVVLTPLLVYVCTVYSFMPGMWEDERAAIPMFFALLALGEMWIAYRTPALMPIRRWLLRLFGEDSHE